MIPHVKVNIGGIPIEVADRPRMLRYLNDMTTSFAAFGEKEVKLRTPGSGTVRALWTTTFVRNAEGQITQALIHNTFSDPPELILWLEGGTKRHDIFPKPGNTKGLMIFYWPILGRTVGARVVHHPGTDPYGMVELAEMHMQANVHSFMAIFEKQLQAFLDGKKK
jgi:hypothetical protein